MTSTFAAVLFVIASFGATQQGQQQGQGQQGQGRQGQGQAQQGQGQQGQGQQVQGRQGQGQQGQGRQQGQQVQGQQGQQTAGPAQIRIGTPTYFTDGIVRGAVSGGWKLAAGAPQTLYAYSGRSLCASSSAVPNIPDDAGYGWRLSLAAGQAADSVEVTWQRLWAGGQKVNDAVHGPVQVPLRRGSRIVLDYLGAQPSGNCDAVGMALEISVDGPVSNSVLQADLWLVSQPQNPPTNDPARSQRQTVRVGASGNAAYFFDDFAIDPHITVRISGALEKVEIKDGEVTMDLKIAQSVAGSPNAGGSTTYAVSAKLGDTIAFKLPSLDAFFFNLPSSTAAAKIQLPLSLLLRAEQIREP